MAQLFRPGANTIARLALFAIPLGPLAAIALLIGLQRSNYVTGVDETPAQPIPFSHQHHAGELGIDCRYCHTSVEKAAFAGVPPTHTCMTCHSQLYTDAGVLAPARLSLAMNKPIAWQRVNRLPGYVYFDHHVHVKNGVPCTACHGDVRQMPITRQAAPLTMGWCLDCHRDPKPRLVPAARVFDSAPHGPTDAAIAHRVAAKRGLTDCSTCHR